MEALQIAAPLNEGKTKCVYAIPGEPTKCVIVSKDDVTAGDGAKHDIIPGKGAWATTTTCNVFRLLKNFSQVPMAFEEQLTDTSFKAALCTMLPFEVVVRSQAFGSYLKRHPEVEKRHVFDKLQCEFFLKTSGKRLGKYGFPVDDPLAVFGSKGGQRVLHIHHPAKPLESNESFLMAIPLEDVVDPNLTINVVEDYQDLGVLFARMQEHAFHTFRVLENAWKHVGGELIDFKVEFGVNSDGALMLADVIDTDSWRVVVGSEHIDKQPYRDGAPLELAAQRFEIGATLTSLPNFK